jgi:amino acid transporter
MKYIGTLKSKLIISLILGIIFSIANSIYSATHVFCLSTPTNPCGGISSITAREILILWFLGFTALFTLLTLIDFIFRKIAKPQDLPSAPNDLTKNSAKTEFLIMIILILGGALLLYITVGKSVIENDNSSNPIPTSNPAATQQN